MDCRICGNKLTHSFADLGMQPPSNAYVDSTKVGEQEIFFPLHAYVCEKCWLVQIDEHQKPDQIFTDYAYLSGVSKSWIDHCQEYTDMIIPHLHLNQDSRIVEIASNDGTLLKCFQQRGLTNVLGVEPAKNVAAIAIQRGVSTEAVFFSDAYAKDACKVDLLIANNVLAHTPILHEFVAGIKSILAPKGVATLEFPHVMRLIKGNQFDTIYQEHFSYFSLTTLDPVFRDHGLEIYAVQELPTHGGSLRIFVRHETVTFGIECAGVTSVLSAEFDAGITKLSTYTDFQKDIDATKWSLVNLLSTEKLRGNHIVGYGAAAKGNTLLNYCGIKPDMLDYVVDRAETKIGKLLPGSRIPVVAESELCKTQPDFVLILPWNLKWEIIEQLSYIRQWEGKFITPIPHLQVL